MNYWYRKRIAILIAILLIFILWGSIRYRGSVDYQIPATNLLSYTIVNQYPHNINSYTQGLFFDGDILYESTGSPDYLPQTQSVLGILDLETGKIDIKAELDRDIYFGEGSTILNNKIYQLTYKNQKGFVYDATTFKEINTFTFPSAEGWGLTNDGDNLIMSDGTDILTYLSPDNFQVIKTLEVKRGDIAQRSLNELEYIKGFIYANIYQTNKIVKINPDNGDIVGILDLSNIVAQTREKQGNIAELNGIAYKASTDTVFITGKLWPQVYEVQLK
jgi:glutaminyl-peptide cyclotransferase